MMISLNGLIVSGFNGCVCDNAFYYFKTLAIKESNQQKVFPHKEPLNPLTIKE
jgi:hypothetical protein